MAINFSNMTIIASSTTNPMDNTKASRVMTLMLRPNKYMAPKETIKQIRIVGAIGKMTVHKRPKNEKDDEN